MEVEGYTGWKTPLLAAGLTAAGLYILGSKRVGAAIAKSEKSETIERARREARRTPNQKSAANAELHLTAAQVRAISNPETAQALQNLQNLLYTRAISDEEFQAAKNNLLRSGRANAHNDALAHLERLVELHEAGILDDVEFTAAKLKVLGLT